MIIMKYIVSINGKNYEVEVEKGEASIISTSTIVAPPQAVAASAAPVAAAPVAAAPTSVAGEAVKAPMPGVILAIKVNPGARVKRGDVLLILEAMKMENEITAPRDGIVAQIVAAKGASVSTGDILVALQ